MREVVSIHIGQAGIQIGNSCRELYCHEHGIRSDGTIAPLKAAGDPSSIFSETIRWSHLPRSIFVDIDPTIVGEIYTDRYHDLYHPDTLINSKEDAANCYSRGMVLGRFGFTEKTDDQIRKVVEQGDHFQGFQIFHSLNGGTGSGLFTLLGRSFYYYYYKIPKINFAVMNNNLI